MADYIPASAIKVACAPFPTGFHRSSITTLTQAANWAVCGFHASVKARSASNATSTQARWDAAARAYYAAYVLYDRGGTLALSEMLSRVVAADALADLARGSSSGGTPPKPAQPDASGDGGIVLPGIAEAGISKWFMISGLAGLAWFFYTNYGKKKRTTSRRRRARRVYTRRAYRRRRR